MISKEILDSITERIRAKSSDAEIILFGSQARGEANEDSDLDILVLVNSDKITFEQERNIVFPLYDLEYKYGKIISPLVLTKKDWKEKHSLTPFYKNVEKEGIKL